MASSHNRDSVPDLTSQLNALTTSPTASSSYPQSGIASLNRSQKATYPKTPNYQTVEHPNYYNTHVVQQHLSHPIYLASNCCASVANAASPSCLNSIPSGAAVIAGQQYTFQGQPAFLPVNSAIPNYFAYYTVPPPDPRIHFNPQMAAVIDGKFTATSPKVEYLAPAPILLVPQTQQNLLPAPTELFIQPSPRPLSSVSNESYTMGILPQQSMNAQMIPLRDPASYSGAMYTSRNFSEGNSRKPQHRSGSQPKRASNSHNSKYKTKPCINYSIKGYCPYGDQCKFIHEEDLVEENLSDGTSVAESDGAVKRRLDGDDDCRSTVSANAIHRMCSSIPVSRRMLQQTELEVIQGRKKTYRQNFAPGTGCKKPNVLDGPHFSGFVNKNKSFDTKLS